jgi:hypothetical protein
MAQHTYGATCAAGPALAVQAGQSWLAFSGGGGLGGGEPNRQINVMPVNAENPDEQFSMANLLVLDDTTAARPALFSFRGSLWLAWTGLDGVGRLNLLRLQPDGNRVQPAERVSFNGTAVGGPALTTYNGRLMLAWCGGGGLGGGEPNGKINLAWSEDGLNWPGSTTPGAVLNQQSFQSPAIAPMIAEAGSNAVLMLAWVGTDGQVNVGQAAEMRFDQFNETPQLTGEHTSHGVGMASNNRSLSDWSVMVAWTGLNEGFLNSLGAGGNTTTVGFKATYQDTADWEPAVCHTGAHESDNWAVAWAGTDAVRKLNVALENDLPRR